MREYDDEQRVRLWTEVAAMLAQELTYAHDALRLARSMILSGERMTPAAESTIRRGLGVQT